MIDIILLSSSHVRLFKFYLFHGKHMCINCFNKSYTANERNPTQPNPNQPNFGVPQWSNLDPTLFLVFIDNIDIGIPKTIIRRSNVNDIC